MAEICVESLRVHFVGVGYDEVDRVVFPLLEWRADKAYLFAHKSERPTNKAKIQREVVSRRLKEAGVDVQEVQIDLWDAPSVASTVRTIMRDDPGHDYRFNVSTGPKPCVIGGFMASMFWPLKLYYVVVDYRSESPVDELSRFLPKEVVSLPTFHSEPPRKKVVQALRMLIDRDGRMTSSELSRHLRESGVIRPMRGDELSAQAVHSQLQSILDSLVHMRFVTRGSGGEKNLVEVTDEGKAAFRLFSDHEMELA